MLKKSLLALAVAGLSANAFAVNLDNGSLVQTLASELEIGSGLIVGATKDATGSVTSTNLTAMVKAGFAITNGYVRVELGNGATFNTKLVDKSLALGTYDGTTGVFTPSTTGPVIKLASGGQNGDNYAIFAITGDLASTDLFELTTDAKVVNANAVPLTYSLYESASNAVNKTGALKTKSGNLLDFAPALVVAATAYAPINKIDAIGNKSLTFDAGFDGTDTTKTKVGLVKLSVDANSVNPVYLADATTQVTASDQILSSYNWTLKGNFSAVATDGLKDAGGNKFTVASDKQSADLKNATGAVTYTVTGKDAIAETSIGAVLTPTAVSGFKVNNFTFDNVANLIKNGTTVALNLALKPGGAFSNFVRITNGDTIPGIFFVKVINDAGQSVSFPLSAVAGQADTIDAGASTTQMSISDIFAAAEAEGLALSGEGKLRLEVTGQTKKVDVQEYTVSTDGTTFATF